MNENSSHRTRTGAGARIGGDHIALHTIVVVGVIIVALVSFAISFTSLLAVAEWQGTPDMLHVLTPLMVDAPVVVFTTATIIFKHREQPVAMWMSRTLSVVATAASSGANFLHTVSVRGLTSYEDWIGASFNAAAPILVLCCTEILGHLITRPKAERGKLQRLEAQVKTLTKQLRAATPRTPRLDIMPAPVDVSRYPSPKRVTDGAS